MQTLPTSSLIRVAVMLAVTAAQAQNLSTLLVLGSSSTIDVVERYRDYTTLTQVANDFGTSAPEYLAARRWFQQAPQPTTLKVGRWAQSSTNGLLRGATLSAAAQALGNFTAVTTGGFTYTKNGGAATPVTGLNLSGATNLNQVASIITAGLTGAVLVWNSVFSRFELTSSTTGSASSISFLTAPGSGTDISALLGMTSGSSGAYRANGINAETALSAVQLFDSSYGQTWYGLTVLGAVNADHLAIAGYIEGTNTAHLYGVTTQEAACLVSGDTSDIAYQLKQLAYNKTTVQFSSSDLYAVCSLLGRMLTVNYTSNNTVITAMFKQEPGVIAENLNTTQAAALKAKACNAFVAYDNNTNIIQNGVVSSGVFLDIITGTDWLKVTIQNALYNLLYTSPTKIPQTDAGTQQLTTTIAAVCSQAVENGLLAPGVWNSAGFGTLAQGDYIPKGFYIYAPRVATQNPVDRAARKAVPIRVAAKLAGAVHEIDMDITVNQ